MKRGFGPRCVGLAVLIAMLVPAETAGADGLPILGVRVDPQGALAPGGEFRYVTRGRGAGTLASRVDADTGRTVDSVRLSGSFTIPAVAYDGSARGISADQSTLVLIRPRARFPQSRTRLALLDVGPMHLRELITLRGDFSFDAISPDGSAIYLIEYLSRDPTEYQVRAYDVNAARLLPAPIVDASAVKKGAMRGNPITRATSPDGRWEYTLYDGLGEPFVHVLDASEGTARCVFLPNDVGRGNITRLGLSLSLDGGQLSVMGAQTPLAVIDTQTFEVSEPDEATSSAPSEQPSRSEGVALWPMLVVAGLAVLLLAGTRVAGMRARNGRT